MLKSEKKLYELFRHFMEQISLEFVRMGLYWRCEDFETNTENDPFWPDLKWRLEYTDYFMRNCKVTVEGIFPYNSIPQPINIINKYSLVYDAGYEYIYVLDLETKEMKYLGQVGDWCEE